MTGARLRGLRHDLDQLFREGSLAGASDARLLERFVAEEDAAAFEALVARHRDMVLRTCHDLLGDAAEAEEAFQATVVVLLRRAGSVREKDAVGGWLHRVACRVARRTRAEAARRRAGEVRASAARARQDPCVPEADPLVRDELRSALHEEIDRLPDRYRRPVILCLLEGMSQAEAAARLGWSEGSVRGRLTRGRARLRDRLTRRGIALSAVLAALAEPGRAAAAAAAARPVVLGLRTKGAALACSALLTLGGVWLASALAAGDPGKPAARAAAAPPAAPPDVAPEREELASLRGGGPTNESRPAALPPEVAARAVEFRGRVLGPSGRGVAGARLSLVTDAWSVPEPQAVSRDDGSFQFSKTVGDFWRNFAQGGMATPHVQAVVLATHDAFGAGWVNLRIKHKDGTPAIGGEYPLTVNMTADRPIEGRLVDDRGQPVAGASVRVEQLCAFPNGGLAPVLEALRKFDLEPYRRTHPRIWPNNLAAAEAIPPATTGADGRFTLKGVGRDRQANLAATGPGMEAVQWTVLNSDEANEVTRAVRARWPGRAQPGGRPAGKDVGRGDPGVAVYGPASEIRVVAAPTVRGVVRDASTGRPVKGATAFIASEAGWANSAVTDEQGVYRMIRGDRLDRLRLGVRPPQNSNWLGVARTFEGVPASGEFAADFTLPRAVAVSGRAVERGTGRPMLAARRDGCHGPGPVTGGRVWYRPLAGNTWLTRTQVGEYLRQTSTHDRGLFMGLTDSDGKFPGAVPPGPGVLLLEAAPGMPFMWSMAGAVKERDGLHRRYPYAPLARREPDDGAPRAAGGTDDTLPGLFGPIALAHFVAYRVIDPAPGEETLGPEIRIPTAASRRVRFVDPDGRPVRGVTVTGLTALAPMGVVLEGEETEVLALDPHRGRRLSALSPDGRLWAETTISGDAPDPVTVRMRPSAAVTGRLVDDHGNPVEGASVSAGYLAEEPGWIPGLVTRHKTDAGGSFRVDGLFPGRPVKIEFWRAGKQFLENDRFSPGPLARVVPEEGKTRDVGTVSAKASP
jgi:RNA polymerase sigma factor (sigma-70 family)